MNRKHSVRVCTCRRFGRGLEMVHGLLLFPGANKSAAPTTGISRYGEDLRGHRLGRNLSAQFLHGKLVQSSHRVTKHVSSGSEDGARLSTAVSLEFSSDITLFVAVIGLVCVLLDFQRLSAKTHSLAPPGERGSQREREKKTHHDTSFINQHTHFGLLS